MKPLALILLMAPCAFAQNPAAMESKPPRLTSDDDKTLYALGAMLGRNITVFKLTRSELKTVTMGLEDQVLGNKLQADPAAYGAKLNELLKKKQAAAAEKEKQRSKAFLEEAKKEPGVTVTPSGLIYKDIRPGTGANPAATGTVKVHYHGTLTDGKVFDSSVQRGQPLEFALNGVIPCWTEGVQKMKVGGKARLICPPEIAYGDQGSPPNVPGGAALIFEVELLDIRK